MRGRRGRIVPAGLHHQGGEGSLHCFLCPEQYQWRAHLGLSDGYGSSLPPSSLCLPVAPVVILLIKKIFFNVHLFLRERDRVQAGEEQRERGRHRIQSRLQSLSCQHRARHEARTHEPRDRDLSRSQTSKQLSRPGAPPFFFFFPKYLCFKRETV